MQWEKTTFLIKFACNLKTIHSTTVIVRLVQKVKSVDVDLVIVFMYYHMLLGNDSVTLGIFFLHVATQRRCETSYRQNCMFSTPASQPVSPKIALRVFHVTRYAAGCKCFAVLSSPVRCKLQGKFSRATGPLQFSPDDTNE